MIAPSIKLTFELSSLFLWNQSLDLSARSSHFLECVHVHDDVRNRVPQRNRPAVDDLRELGIHELSEPLEEPLVRLNLALVSVF